MNEDDNIKMQGLFIQLGNFMQFKKSVSWSVLDIVILKVIGGVIV